MSGQADPFSYPIDIDGYRQANHSWLDELDEVVVHSGDPQQRMGTRSIDPASWLVVDEHYAAEVALRGRLLAEAGPAVYRATVASRPAAAEAAAMVRDWLGQHSPPAIGSWVDRPNDPLLSAGTVIQEDLCVMERGHDGWRLTAALVCFPSNWDLADKFDRPQEHIHQPVANYATDLEAKVNRFFDRLAPNRLVSRRNWGFSADPLLFLPRRTELTADPGAFDALWFRSERQTLRRLPISGGVLFTIKVQMAPLAAVAERPELCRLLRAAMRGFTPELAAGRGRSPQWLAAMDRWLTAAIGDNTPQQQSEVSEPS